MYGFLFWIFLAVILGFITIGVVLYVKDKKRQSANDEIREVKIWGLKASTFYEISMASLIFLFLLYENPASIKWSEQHKIDVQQSCLIDSLKKENDNLRQIVNDLKELQVLHNQLDEKLINVSGKRDVVIVNNRPPRHKHCVKDSFCCDSVKLRRCL